MGDIQGEIKRWRLKAHEARATADTLSNAIAMDTLLDMAERYERLADHLETLEQKRRERLAG